LIHACIGVCCQCIHAVGSQ